ncbi:hypothetical protein ADUPG1_004304, partial [Aduncisulcus paluster]
MKGWGLVAPILRKEKESVSQQQNSEAYLDVMMLWLRELWL